MCGIAGYITKDQQADRDIATRMLQSIQHRGPDQFGVFIGHHLAMGCARLQIIDLKGGTQPIQDTSQRYTIVYNGEVYNYLELRAELEELGHTFESTTDTEVVLKSWIHWGESSLSRLNGGFAFAIYDRSEKQTVFARDRFGKRPLFFSKQKNSFVFGSEIKALAQHPDIALEFDPNELKKIFGLWTPVLANTAFKNIKQVKPGHFLVVKKDLSFHESCFASIDDGAEKQNRDLDDPSILSEARDHLRESVRLRSRSDVEVALTLSGGLDSTVLTQLAREVIGDNLRTFSLAFENSEFDESPYQQEVHQFYGTQHEEIRINSDQVAEAYDAAVWHAETPVFRTAFVPMYLLSKLIRSHGIKVVLSGEGSDELFLGYNIFKETRLRSQWGDLDRETREKKLLALYPYLSHFKQANAKILYSLFEKSANVPMDLLYSHHLRVHNSQLSMRMIEGPDPVEALTREFAEFYSEADRDPVDQAQFNEIFTLLNGYLLSSQGDRAMFAHSVEGRCPYLDPSLAKWSFSLRNELKLADQRPEKWILREAFAKDLPPQIFDRKKQPYRSPDFDVFQSEFFKQRIVEVKTSDFFKDLPFLNEKLVHQFIEKFASRTSENVSHADTQTMNFLMSTYSLYTSFHKAQTPVHTEAIELNRLVEETAE